MAKLLAGAPVSQAICERIRPRIQQLNQLGVTPTLGIVRVGDRSEDIRYERGATKRANSLGVAVSRTLLPTDIPESELVRVLHEMNDNPRIHGCLLFRPLPAHLNTAAVRESLRPEKDIDAMTSVAMGSLVFPESNCFPPCTADACLELLRFYQIPLAGKNVVIVGTGATVGMPTALMLINKGATVSACNILTDPQHLRQLCQGADIIVSAAGKAGLINRAHVHPGQIVLDVGVSFDASGAMRGDVDAAQVDPVVAALTPVPGGVGAVTSTVLSAHTVEAALRANGLPADVFPRHS